MILTKIMTKTNSTKVQNPQPNCKQGFTSLLPAKRLSVLPKALSHSLHALVYFIADERARVHFKTGSIHQLLVSRECLRYPVEIPGSTVVHWGEMD